MIDKRLLLNTYSFGDKAKFTSAFATGIESCPVDIGSPCVIDKTLFDIASDKDSVPALFSFNHSFGGKPNHICNVRKKNITIRNGKCIANSSIKAISTFDFDKMKSLSEYIDKQGSIVFSLFTPNPFSAATETNKNAIVFINKIYDTIINRYLYYSVPYISYTKSTTPPLGDLRFIIHFLSIPNCIPILNRRKVDGMGMVFNIVSLKSTLKYRHMKTIFCMSVILSNYKENIFIIDGIDIRKQKEIKAEYLIDAEKIIKKNMRQKSEYFLKQKKTGLKKKPTNEDVTDGWTKVIFSNDSSSTTYTTASVSSGNYYIHS